MLYNLKNKKKVKEFGQVHGITMNAMCLDDTDKYLFTGGAEGFVLQWDVEKQVLYKTWDGASSDWLVSIGISP